LLQVATGCGGLAISAASRAPVSAMARRDPSGSSKTMTPGRLVQGGGGVLGCRQAAPALQRCTRGPCGCSRPIDGRATSSGRAV
jgi:hypothetical protein